MSGLNACLPKNGRVGILISQNSLQQYKKCLFLRRRRVAEHHRCQASMGIGFTSDESSGLKVPSKNIVDVRPEYGLSVKQMQVLGLSPESMTKLPEVDAVSLSID